VIALEINPGDGWRDMTVEEDYSEELEELTAEPWHPSRQSRGIASEPPTVKRCGRCNPSRRMA